jgi:riboflavin kinase/FMN adenylyltransferase
MEVYWNLDDVQREGNSALTVGTFDGVHRGHQFILEELKRQASRISGPATVVTFHPHPRLVLRGDDRPPLRILTTPEEKIDILQGLGISRLVIIPFTTEFSKTSSIDFVENILWGRLGFQVFVIGHDHGFGKNREGDVETLRLLKGKLGFDVVEVPPFTVNGVVVSSTKVRKLLEAGAVAEAAKLIGRPYGLQAEVVSGDGRGRLLDFPTANLKPLSPAKLIPRDGVYAVFVYLDGERFSGMMNIGVRPTFGEEERTLEVHLHDFDRDIYGKVARVEFIERIRDERRFATPELLQQQLQEDQQKTLNVLKEVQIGG